MGVAEQVADPRVGGEHLLGALDLLEAITHRPAWHAQARCRGYGPEAFFDRPEAGVAVCARCIVRAECEEAGGAQEGVWGGFTQAQRKRRRRARRLAAA